MKRKHKKEYEHGIYKHYGLFFWKQCSCCKKDFRREKGFRFLAGPFILISNGGGAFGRWYYLCESCSPTKDTANDYAINSKFIGARPSPSPRPPAIQ